jgi:hypothetical protein
VQANPWNSARTGYPSTQAHGEPQNESQKVRGDDAQSFPDTSRCVGRHAVTLIATQPRIVLNGARAQAAVADTYRQLILFGAVFERVRADYVAKEA